MLRGEDVREVSKSDVGTANKYRENTTPSPPPEGAEANIRLGHPEYVNKKKTTCGAMKTPLARQGQSLKVNILVTNHT